MEFRLLGNFEVVRDGRPVSVGRRRQERLLLAILLLAAGRPVATDRLTDLLWEGAPPANARGAVHTYVGRLRAALSPYGVPITTKGRGYAAAAGQVDATRFTDLARDAAGTTDPAERVRLGGAALALWRGPLLADLVDEPLRQRLGEPLRELRLSVAETCARSLLDMGHHDRVVRDLTGLAEQHPGREALVASVMTALYRSARQADALRLYDHARKTLIGDLGVEPGPDLETVRQRILVGDPRLDRPAAPVYAVRVRDHWLPWSVGGHPALEFCNTYAGWGGERIPGAEWLRGYSSLAVWAGHQDLLDDSAVTGLLAAAAQDPVGAATVLDEARQLRERLYTCLTDPADSRAFAAVARYVEAAARDAVFRRGADGLGGWHPSRRAGLRAPLHAVARSAGELLADPRRSTVCACPGPDCGWLFLDRSGRRRFCSLATCGHPAAP
ncbi:DNA-binding SARP family transcriptional activator [Micromonospora sp. Llam0]|uniref:BTAD domain-containing putative transcriptional regulator n=1 Tax=Micromonospora sp. Llam0 TaxID=2485143 RepID=UPI000F47CF4C|nr:BTAD domain-containing putative transcriptional regulator [Micromonospora sp. Llam0]ROO52657.1 DNA-binding SARP family transcriptional activator [Micromonospora sp. Llam0]